jgi:hypothetical protein
VFQTNKKPFELLARVCNSSHRIQNLAGKKPLKIGFFLNYFDLPALSLLPCLREVIRSGIKKKVISSALLLCNGSMFSAGSSPVISSLIASTFAGDSSPQLSRVFQTNKNLSNCWLEFVTQAILYKTCQEKNYSKLDSFSTALTCQPLGCAYV